MNETDMPPEPEEPEPQIKVPWWLTDSGMARMRELEDEIDQINKELRNGH